MLKYILLLFLASCADDGSFDFSRTETNTNSNNTSIQIEQNENGQQSSNPSQGSGSNPICQSVQSFGDGTLSKPISDSDGNLVFLFSKRFTEKFIKVTLIDGSGFTEEGRFSGFGNGGRQHYRFSKPGAEYVAPLRIIAESLNGECEFIVEDPSQRTE